MTYLKRTTTKEEKAKIAKSCFEMQEQLRANGKVRYEYLGLCANDLTSTLYDAFKNNYPFGGLPLYARERAKGTLYKNKARRDFIRRWAKKHEMKKFA